MEKFKNDIKNKDLPDHASTLKLMILIGVGAVLGGYIWARATFVNDQATNSANEGAGVLILAGLALIFAGLALKLYAAKLKPKKKKTKSKKKK